MDWHVTVYWTCVRLRGKTIDFLPIWLCVDPKAIFIFITQTGAERRGASCLCFQFPWQHGSSESEEVRLPVRGECGFTEINITWNTLYSFLFLCLDRSESVHLLLRSSEIREPFSLPQATSLSSSFNLGGTDKGAPVEQVSSNQYGIFGLPWN